MWTLPTVNGGAHSVQELRHNLLVVAALLLYVFIKCVILQLSGVLLLLVASDFVQFMTMLLLYDEQ